MTILGTVEVTAGEAPVNCAKWYCASRLREGDTAVLVVGRAGLAVHCPLHYKLPLEATR